MKRLKKSLQTFAIGVSFIALIAVNTNAVEKLNSINQLPRFTPLQADRDSFGIPQRRCERNPLEKDLFFLKKFLGPS